MKKIRNDKIDGNFYTDEYIGNLTNRIYELEKELEKYKNIIEEIKKILDKDQCVEYCYMDVVNYLCEIEGKEKVYDR